MYPDRHHPVFMLEDALKAGGVNVEFARDERTLGCWGLIFPDFDNRVMVWLIDNRLPHEAAHEDPAALELLQRGAIVAHAQKLDYERVGGEWLPLAVSPGFEPLDIRKTADVGFVGYMHDLERVRLLSDIGQQFTLSMGRGVFGVKASEVYASARVGLNVPSHYGKPYCLDVNMRCFEVAACGIPLVTNELPELPELGFLDGVTCVVYGNTRTIQDAVKMALKSPEIGIAGLELVNSRHLYSHRAKQVMQWLSE